MEDVQNHANDAWAACSAPLLRRLRHTPLRDVVRFRVTGRLDLRRMIESSGLPAPVRELVLRVTRRTRLWRLEKVDVARELLAHFHDGLAGGASAEGLAKSFGDERSAARLIRKAKKRQRPLAWRAMNRSFQACGVVLGLLIVFYGFIAIRFYMSRPTPTRNYVAELNAPILAIPESERAWPLYREALLKMPKLRALERNLTQARRDREREEQAQDETDKVAERERIATTLREESEGVVLLREAARRPSLGFPMGDLPCAEEVPPVGGSLGLPTTIENTPFALELLLPHLLLLRNGARILAWDAQQAATDGDGAALALDIEAMLGMAAHVRQPSMMIAELVSFSIAAQAFDALGRAIEAHPEALSPAQLQTLAHRIAAFRGGGRMVVDLSGERMWFNDLLQRSYTDNGASDGHLTPAGARLLLTCASYTGSSDVMEAAMPLAGVLSASRRELLAEYERIFALSESDFTKPLWEIEEFAGDREVEYMHEGSLLARAKYFPIWLLMPAAAQAHVAAERTTQRRDAVLVAIALELFRRDHGGAWPQGLRELAPKYLPAVPPDRFDGRPLKYILSEGRPVVYSVGVDRDDDGGRPPGPAGTPLDASRWMAPSAVQQHKAGADASSPLADGDWILWPAP